MNWIPLTERMPNPDTHERVLIYTQGVDFNGQTVFDVKTDTLNECFFDDSDNQPEECKCATHWTAKPDF